MRIFRVKKDMITKVPKENFYNSTIFKGQMFFVDNQCDLPAHNDTAEDAHKEYWEELELYNNYGHVKLTPKY